MIRRVLISHGQPLNQTAFSFLLIGAQQDTGQVTDGEWPIAMMGNGRNSIFGWYDLHPNPIGHIESYTHTSLLRFLCFVSYSLLARLLPSGNPT